MTLSPTLKESANRLAEGHIANLERLKASVLAEMDARIDARVDARVAELLAASSDHARYNA